MYGELPSDLNTQDDSLGPPPSWFRPESGVTTPEQAAASWYSYPYAYYARTGTLGRLGDREQEIEVNPMEELRALKFNQELNKKIPVQANRYTKIDPLSPLFRDEKAKFGYGSYTLGEVGESTLMRLVLMAMTISNFYHGYKRNSSALWGFLWILLGPIGVALSLAQGYGKPS